MKPKKDPIMEETFSSIDDVISPKVLRTKKVTLLAVVRLCTLQSLGGYLVFRGCKLLRRRSRVVPRARRTFEID
jgi:hypothetical protein